MERKIGETFEFEDHKLRVVEGNSIRCKECFFNNRDCSSIRDVRGLCSKEYRTDDKYVIFQPQEQAEQSLELNLCEILKDCPQGEPFWSPMFGDVKLCGIDQVTQQVVVILTSGETWDINANGTISIDEVTSPEIMLYPSREQRDWTTVKYEPKKERFDPKTFKPFDRVIIRNAAINFWKCDLLSHIVNAAGSNHYVCVSGGCYNKYCIPYNDDTKHIVGTNEEAPEYYRYWED